MKYSSEQLEKISKKLKEMPSIEKKQYHHSTVNSVKILSKEIMSMIKRGYTIEQVSEILQNEGFSIATPTLKNYLNLVKTKKKSPKKSKISLPLDNIDISFNTRSDSNDI